MARDEVPAKRRIQFIVRECSCPGLIANLSQIPEGDENVFIRAVLTEWFSLNALSGNSAEAARRLVDKYRIVEFRNANGIRSEVDSHELPSSLSMHLLSAEMPREKIAEEPVAVVSAPIPIPKLEDKVTVPVPLTIPAVTATPTPPSVATVGGPSLHVEFDPDTF